ncbi:hypothetical protein HB364_07665 [Pseudoflavitalea sp. X16]|uniref:hypothetical protein n=1 Tax=Paraflavitalea devenefica TaxID=2716334 RepID=UPI00141F96A4|nr:hypothetical protein [Paraflavitalea devenefica]NII24950.1 hypothetical protein [Paraflavitalea devenefica]
MNWKKFLMVCINVACLAMPYNIIGCAGGDPDPYDYFVSFFNRNNAGVKGYEPFYYTNYRFLYQEEEPVNTSDLTSAEWVKYGNNGFTANDARQFVTEYARKDLSSLYYHLEKNQPLQVPDSVKNNGMTQFFMTSKDLEALGYIMYAKQVEPNVTGYWTSWEPIERDTARMGKLMKNGQQLYAVAKNIAIKLRLAYQVIRLAHYSKRYTECLRLYDELVKPNNTPGVLQDLCLGLKAGALMHTGQKEEAALIFSQLFSKSELKRVSNYMSFDWCVKRFEEENRRACMALAQTNEDKANLLGLFVLGSNKEELNALEEIYGLSPNAALLEILTIREVNKLEEYYFTPALEFEKGKKQATINYSTVDPTDKTFVSWQEEGTSLIRFCQEAVANKSVSNKGLYSLAAAHAAIITRDYAMARKLLAATRKLKLSPKLEDQWAMSNLLLTINAKDVMDDAFEKQLLPSLQWLEKKAATDAEYAKFYRRLFTDVISPKYQKSNNARFVLSVGVADWVNQQYVKEGWGYYGNHALTTLRYKMTAQQVEQLIQLMESKKLTAFEQYLVGHNSFSKDDVNDVAGTTWLRQFDFAAAQKWFAKVSPAYYQGETYSFYLAANPFADLILDTHASTEQDTAKYTKLSFCRKMWGLEQEVKTNNDPERKAKAYYELAKGLYQMSYWGNSWLLVHYDWSGNDGLHRGDDDQPGDKEYYGVYKAEEYYMKAYNLTQNKNFKARCLFMAAKCEQKQIPVPSWSQFKDYSDYEKATAAYSKSITQNAAYFPLLAKEYSTTAFYKEAFNTCSYLKDFVSKKK